jgi:hypothetical protein
MAQRGTAAKIDMDELEKLCAMQATDGEIAAWFGVTTRTIERRRKNRAFAEVMERGKAKGRLSMRRAQIKLLEQGNATMAVWLGKQYLGQTDQIRHQMRNAPFVLVMPRELPESRPRIDEAHVIDVRSTTVCGAETELGCTVLTEAGLV